MAGVNLPAIVFRSAQTSRVVSSFVGLERSDGNPSMDIAIRYAQAPLRFPQGYILTWSFIQFAEGGLVVGRSSTTCIVPMASPSIRQKKS